MASKGHYSRNKSDAIREAARRSISAYYPAKSLELRHTIHMIQELSAQIEEIEAEIKAILDKINCGYRVKST